jgi:EutQ-like cupin domain
VRYTKVVSTDDGGSRFEDVDVEMKPALAAKGVPPLLLSAPVSVASLAFLQQPEGVGEWALHPAPQRQFAIVLSGRAAIQTSDGARREFGPGDVVLLEDTTGIGHVSTPTTSDFRIAVVPLS